MKNELGNSGEIYTYKGMTPKIHPSAFICDGVKIIGNVEIAEDVSIWFNTVIRGDVHHIKIGARSNIQDMSMLHVTNEKFPLEIGEDVSVAHSVSLHGCTLKNGCLIGIGAIVLDGATVGEGALVGAGTLVREGFEVPPYTLFVGTPGRVIRELTPAERLRVSSTPGNYIKYSSVYREELVRQYAKHIDL